MTNILFCFWTIIASVFVVAAVSLVVVGVQCLYQKILKSFALKRVAAAFFLCFAVRDRFINRIEASDVSKCA